jgi:ABC-type multidrug transport system fused ATPase/permease subunit
MSPVAKILALLSRQQKKAGIALLVLMLIAMVLETAGVGLIIPVIAVIADPSAGERYPLLEVATEYLGGGKATLVAAVMTALVLLYLVKSIFLGVLAWWQGRYVYSIESDLSRRLYAGYLLQPYHFHMQRNSALLVRNVTTGVGQLAGAVMAGAVLASECLVLIGIAALLLYAEPLGALLVGGLLTVAGTAYYRLMRDRILRWGEARQYHEGQRLRRLQQGLGGIREIKLLGREHQFVAEYETHNIANAAVAKRQSIVMALPRLWLELLAVSGISLLVAAMISQGKPIEAVVPTIGLFAAAAFRLMPSVNKVLNALQNLRYNLPFIDTMYAERSMLGDDQGGQRQQERLPFEDKIVLEHLHYRYPESSVDVIKEACLQVRRGETVGFIGPSGAGKSTLVNLILGLLDPTEGRVLVDGRDIHERLSGWQACIGYVPQSIFLIDDSLRRNVAFGIPEDEIDDAEVMRALRAAQLADFVDSLPDGIHTSVGERGVRLSGGQSQRVGIARALYYDPPVLVLDEASSALDSATEGAVMATVNSLRGNKTMLIIAHRLSTIAGCDELYEVEAGCIRRLAADERNQLLLNGKALRD